MSYWGSIMHKRPNKWIHVAPLAQLDEQMRLAHGSKSHKSWEPYTTQLKHVPFLTRAPTDPKTFTSPSFRMSPVSFNAQATQAMKAPTFLGENTFSQIRSRTASLTRKHYITRLSLGLGVCTLNFEISDENCVGWRILQGFEWWVGFGALGIRCRVRVRWEIGVLKIYKLGT